MNKTRRRQPPCPCCGTPGGFCELHKARLAAIRAALFDRGQFQQRTDQRGYRPPKCCNPQCDVPRPKGSAFCPECVADGWEEEAA